jgi:hypothetical protein
MHVPWSNATLFAYLTTAHLDLSLNDFSSGKCPKDIWMDIRFCRLIYYLSFLLYHLSQFLLVSLYVVDA